MPAQEVTTEAPGSIGILRHHMLETFRESPSLFRATYIDKTVDQEEMSAAMRLGLACDYTVLSGRAADVTVIEEKLVRSTSKESMAKKDQIKTEALAKDGVWLTHSENVRLQRMVDACAKDREFQELLAKNHEAQKRLFWTCQWTGLPKRGTLDYVADQIIDLKTTGSWNLHHRRIFRHIFDRGTHRQLAMYQEGWLTLTGQKLPTSIVYVGNDQPHDVVVIPVDQTVVDLGCEENRQTCNDLADALAYGDWRTPLKRQRPTMMLTNFNIPG